jgi:hypothetical protein
LVKDVLACGHRQWSGDADEQNACRDEDKVWPTAVLPAEAGTTALRGPVQRLAGRSSAVTGSDVEHLAIGPPTILAATTTLMFHSDW